jgi:release factor glutamine methyltransferase
VAIVDELRAAGCVAAEDEARLLTEAAANPQQLAQLVARRVTGVPLEHILGWAEFCRLRIYVTDGVFVPRPRSEILVGEAIKRARPGGVVVDLCCGSAAFATVIAKHRPDLEVHAADLDPAAIACARRNLGANVHQGDLFDALPDELRGRVDVLVANAPYVPTDRIVEMPVEARVYEPMLALDGGADGLDVLRRIIDGAGDWLAPGGSLIVESSWGQGSDLSELMARAGMQSVVLTDAGDTIVAGAIPAPA